MGMDWRWGEQICEATLECSLDSFFQRLYSNSSRNFNLKYHQALGHRNVHSSDWHAASGTDDCNHEDRLTQNGFKISSR